ncbi:DUF2242 domain-containing protein [Trinickia terrae]|uniref:DUF2242 domain-containing protein n=1 Tax=Trinickia terrae TaxID=2571161 RepID=A0A4U1IDK7_9BURK|nr:DUF2242 domain-containing protein [Trinickia terrae]TKC91753.1 DUF2242 domain-containing protein [Trinickia terrae]
MPTRFSKAHGALTLAALAAFSTLAACSSAPPPQKYQQEMFDTGVSQYSRNLNASAGDACEAARRTLLNQGYVTTVPHPDSIVGTKDFQSDGDKHVQVEFHVVCVPGEETSDTSIVYANAVQNGFALKKSDTSATVGLSIIGSISMPIRSNSDEMVKVSSETIQSDKFYDRFFEFVERYLPKVVKKADPVPAAAITSTAIPGAAPAAPSAPAASSAPAKASIPALADDSKTPALIPAAASAASATPAATPPASP